MWGKNDGENGPEDIQHRPQQRTTQELPQVTQLTLSHPTPTPTTRTETCPPHQEEATNQETIPRTVTRHTQTRSQNKSLPTRAPLNPANPYPPEPTAQESPSPASSPSDRAHQQTLNPRSQNNHVLSDIPHSEYSEPNNSLSTHRITRFADSTGTLYLPTTITVFITYLFS